MIGAEDQQRLQVALGETLGGRDDIGAAFVVASADGVLVDLWAGCADPATRRPWREDTLAPVFSGTKGVLAACVLLLLERGLLGLDAPVARFWPGFAAAGARVADVMGHTARLPAVDGDLSLEDFADARTVAEALARTRPSRDPRAGICYHPFTYGWLCAELIRRVDGRDAGRFIAEEIAEPLGIELWLGLPAALAERVATMVLDEHWPSSALNHPEAHAADPLLAAIWGNPPVFTREGFAWNRPELHAAGVPGAGGIATARAMATFYARLPELLAPATLELAATTLAEGHDAVHDSPARFGVGFQLQTSSRHLGPPADAFGHGGAGGSCHGAWPAHGIGFSYISNLMCDHADPDPRPTELLSILARALVVQECA